MSATWACPACGRRVPHYVAVCHCGAGRPTEPAAGAARPRPGPAGAGVPRVDPRDVPWQVWVALGVAAVALLGGLVGLFVKPRPQPLVPLLGYGPMAPRAVASTPRPSPRPSPSPVS